MLATFLCTCAGLCMPMHTLLMADHHRSQPRAVTASSSPWLGRDLLSFEVLRQAFLFLDVVEQVLCVISTHHMQRRRMCVFARRREGSKALGTECREAIP